MTAFLVHTSTRTHAHTFRSEPFKTTLMHSGQPAIHDIK